MRTAVALSGGADSLLTLHLLREKGVPLTGVHAFFLPPSEEDRALAQRIEAGCRDLDVPFFALDLSAEFEKQVIQPFIRAYTRGRTPNPCAICNPRIKFGLLRDRVRDLGTERLATGHYARLAPTESGPGLFRGKDPAKDQSYFLSLVPVERFSGVEFPLGTWRKTDVQAELQARGLRVPAGGESQEVCFIPEDYRAFLTDRGVPLSGPGPVRTVSGEPLGNHPGLWRYTLGQRRGLGIPYSEPLYVIAKEYATNTLVVDTREKLNVAGCTAVNLNILVPQERWPERVLAQTVYRQTPKPATVSIRRKTVTIRFEEPRSRPTPGQVAAIYSEQGQVLAGAEISDSLIS
ncbi:MAG TPA: tRNA 2-thiouridine(34) synthase MnmA [Desulfomicrobiaceae bacterium]|nr:tRNA 2-thiouridine(34) synthase MnmA [Desulfomicrobiaceae bacterium]